MGRKIPGRKHHGIRDPEKQREVRLDKLKNKINAPPVDPDEQHIPKSVLRISELMNRAKFTASKSKQKNGKKFTGKHTKPKQLASVPEKPIPKFIQQKGESDKHFMYRVNMMCENVKREAAFENKYRVDVKRNAKTGEVEGLVKRPKDILAVMIKESKQTKKTKKQKANKEEKPPRLTKSQKRQIKLKERKNRKQLNNLDEFETVADKVEFGDVVHEPPTLVTPRRVQTSNVAPRPGRKELHLKSLLNPSERESNIVEKVKSKEKIINKIIDKTGKRKTLPNALRRQLDNQQKDIIDAYKLLKSNKHKL